MSCSLFCRFLHDFISIHARYLRVSSDVSPRSMRRTTRRFPRISFKVRLIFQNLWQSIHPASRGVAAHTAGLFRSVRGAKGGFPPWGLPKLGNFHFLTPPVGAPQAREFSLFPPVGAPQAREFSLFPPVGAPQAREFSLFPPVMFPVKHTVIYTFFAITSVQNTCFCSVFNALASKNPAKSCYVQCFFHFWPFFHCRKATKMTQNSISIPSCAQTPKNPRKMSKTPLYSGLGAKPFLAPPS